MPDLERAQILGRIMKVLIVLENHELDSIADELEIWLREKGGGEDGDDPDPGTRLRLVRTDAA